MMVRLHNPAIWYSPILEKYISPSNTQRYCTMHIHSNTLTSPMHLG